MQSLMANNFINHIYTTWLHYEASINVQKDRLCLASGLLHTCSFGGAPREDMEAPCPFLIPCPVHLFHLTIPAAAAKSLQSCPTLCDPIDGSPPGSSVPGILQARTLEWVAISFSNACMHAKLLQSCPILRDPLDGSPPGSSVHRIL